VIIDVAYRRWKLEGHRDSDFFDWRMDSFVQGGMKETVYEPTYITDPDGYGEGARFRRHKVQALLQTVLKEKMEKQKYDPVRGPQVRCMQSVSSMRSELTSALSLSDCKAASG
jgi:hypothetical protein